MNFNHSDDRRLLQESLSRYVREQYPHEKRMQAAESDHGFSVERYREMCELGIAGALLPESVGGYGGSGFDLAVVFEELGRGLVVEPFLASAVLGGRLLSEMAGQNQRELIAKVVDGSAQLAFAHSEPDSRYELSRVATTATASDRGWVLNGRKSMVLSAASADYLLLSARSAAEVDSESGIALFLIDAKASGLPMNSYPTVDGYRAADIVLDNFQVGSDALLGSAGEAYPAIEKVLAAAVVALCAEALGAMEVCKETTLEYLQTRKQFGVPIGKFQALQHRLVDVLIEIEQARSAVINAAGNLDADRHTRERYVSAAKNLIGRAARQVAEESIQMHGGIAMTWEYSVPHYAKRLIMMDHLLGDTDYHLERFMRFSK